MPAANSGSFKHRMIIRLNPLLHAISFDIKDPARAS
jgi:hypothetical protein